MAWTASLALAYFCKRNLKNETEEIHGVHKIMEKSMQSPLTVKEFLVVPSLYRFTHSLQNKANANAVEDAWKLQYAALVHSQRMGISY